MNRWGC